MPNRTLFKLEYTKKVNIDLLIKLRVATVLLFVMHVILTVCYGDRRLERSDLILVKLSVAIVRVLVFHIALVVAGQVG